MLCPSCKKTIDDDSCYCDQCGEQILICSVCGRPGKGKRCIIDGKELIPAGSGKTIQPLQTSPASVKPTQQNVAAANIPDSDKIKLTSQIHDITIEAKDGDIIGSKKGAFAGVFGRFNFVSGTHCKFVKNAAGWHVQDIGSNNEGSTNGTFINGNKLDVPLALYHIPNNTILKIADVELLVTYDTEAKGTTRL